MDAARTVASIRVLTINTHKGFTALNRRFVLPELREAIRAVGADLVFLQEVQGEHARHAQRFEGWPLTPHYEFLADSLWPQFAYGRNAVYPHGHHGNAVLSKYPIVRSENRDVSIGTTEQRGILHCVLAVPMHDGEVHAICVHLGLLETHRQQQLRLLCDLVTHDVPPQAPLLVAGDFNDWRHRATAILEHQLGMTEVSVALGGRAPRTYPSILPLFPLDRIYVRGFRVRASQVHRGRPWSMLSDHLAVSAELHRA